MSLLLEFRSLSCKRTLHFRFKKPLAIQWLNFILMDPTSLSTRKRLLNHPFESLLKVDIT